MANKMRNGIIKRGDTYTFVVRVLDPKTGKTKNRWVSGYPTHAAAKAARTQAQAEADRGDGCLPDTITVGAYLDRWLTLMEAQVKPKTLDGYRYNVDKYIRPHLGSIRMQALRTPAVTNFYAELAATVGRRGKPLGAATVTSVHRTLRAALSLAVKEQLISRNPASAAVVPAAQRTSSRHHDRLDVYAPRELNRFLLAASSHRLSALFAVAASTGARRGELLFLRWSHVDLDDGYLHIVGTRGPVNGRIEEGTPKGGRGRRVSLPSSTVNALRVHRRRQHEERLAAGKMWEGDPEDPYVFARPDGSPIHPDTPSKLMKTLAASAGLHAIRFHDLRHTHATLLLSAGTPVHEVAHRLGHAKPTITLEVYAKVLNENADRLGDRFGKLLESAR